jgi:hypothetical protein
LENLDTYISADLPEECKAIGTTFFLQAECTQDVGLLNEKRRKGLAVACIGVFMALFFLIMSRYLRKMAAILTIEWDMKTVTAADYTVELKIRPGIYKDYC